jgi:hypothetical protein
LDILKEKGPQGIGINAIAKRPLFQNTSSLFWRNERFAVDFAQRRLLNLFWPLMKKKDNLENLKVSSREGTKELRENVLAQEILRWQLIENNEDTKGLLSTSTHGLEKHLR